jgi:hypothetical protein
MPFSRTSILGQGVTNGDSHDHIGGDGAQIDHTGLGNIGTHSHAQIDSVLGYALGLHNASAQTPADSLTYYWARHNGLSTTQGLSRVYVPVAGILKLIYGAFTQSGGTNEASTLSIVINGVTTIQISNALVHTAASTVFSKTDMNQAVSAGDYIELKWDTPAWGTNPAQVRSSAEVWIST